MISPPIESRKPKKPSKRTMFIVMLLGLVPTYLLVGFSLLESPFFDEPEPVSPPESTQVIFQNLGGDAEFTLRYVAKPPGDGEAVQGVLTRERSVTRGSAIEETLTPAFPAGTTFFLLGTRRSADSELTDELGPLEFTLDDPTEPILFVYGLDREKHRNALLLPLAPKDPVN